MNYYLGIDGGGTKTRAILIDEQFNTLFDQTYESTYLITQGDQKFKDIFTEILTAAKELAKDNLKYTFIALAGYGEFKQDNERIEANLQTVFKDNPFKVLNDSVGVWAGGLLCEDGIAVIAGTGSNCAGIINDRYERVGGWGYIAGDESSAYWIALKTANAYMKMYDGRIERTELFDLINQTYSLDESNNMMQLLYRDFNCERAKIAAIAMMCTKAAKNGCPVSKAIIEEAAKEMALHITTMAKKLDFKTPIPVSYTGGVFNSSLYVEALKTNLSNSDKQFVLQDPVASAAYGSAVYAFILSGNLLDDSHKALIKTKAL